MVADRLKSEEFNSKQEVLIKWQDIQVLCADFAAVKVKNFSSKANAALQINAP
jgi:hypothetical protein